MLKAPRGAIAVWAVLTVGLLLGFGALVLNAGHLTSVKGELQNGVDAAALAGALQLRGTVDQISGGAGSPAVSAVRTFGAYHYTDKAGGNDLDIKPADVILGEWRPAVRPGCELGDQATSYHDTAGSHFCKVTARDATAAFRINAVYARAERAAGSPGGPVPVFMSAFLGRGPAGTVDQAAEALAISGGPLKWEPSRCVPMVVGVGCLRGANGAECAADAPPDSAGPMYTLGLNPSPVRSAGWSVFSDSQPSDSRVCNVLQTGTACIGLGSYIQVNIGQGNMFNGGCGGGGSKNCDVMKALVGRIVDVPTVSLSGNIGEDCPTNYTGSAWVVGYTALKILAVNCTTNVHNPDCVGSPYCTDSTAPCSQFASGKCMLTQVVCNHQSGAGAGTGGAWTGSSTYHPILVQTRGAAN